MIDRAVIRPVRHWFSEGIRNWDSFWFTPTTNETLAVLRIATGVMLLYTHLVLATDLMAFLGPHSWIDPDTAKAIHDGTFGSSDAGRSYLWWIRSPAVLWIHQLVTIVVTFCFAVGFLTRVMGPLTWFLQLMVIHRLTGALFGLDQIVTYAAMYLAFTPCGSLWSVDAILRKRFDVKAMAGKKRKGSVGPSFPLLFPTNDAAVSSNIATRLFQLHLCVIYLFGGLAKARGESWWDGTAMWYAIANYEYQSLDLTWLGRFPRVFSMLSHITLFWEIFYCALVWPRWSRPAVLLMAVAVHAGIAFGLGMMTFGLMMIAANMIFIRPETMGRIMTKTVPTQ